MSDRRPSAELPHIDADAVARHAFSSSFRGYDTDEVRAYLLALAEQVRALNEHASWMQVQLADAEARATAHVQLDEDRLTTLLGEETARVLAAAREAAASILARAEAEAERTVSEANEQATSMRSDAATEALRHRERAEAAAMAEVEAAKAHGRQLITDAQALRERVLADLARRRNAGRAQLEHLREGRDRLLGAYEVVQRTLDHAVESLRVAAPEAQAIGVAPEPPAIAAPDEGDQTEGVRVITPIEPAVEEVAAVDEPITVVEQITVVEVTEEEITVEEITVAVTEETPVLPDDPTLDESVDDLFARIRAGRAEEVAKAEEVLADTDTAADADAPGAEEPPGSPDAEEASPDVFEVRAQAVAPLETALGRKLRRVLADEQNEVLDRLRRGAAQPGLDDLVGPASEHARRYAEAARADLAGAARAGADIVAEVSDAEPADLDDVVTDLGEAITGALRERLTSCLADSAGDVEEATELVRATYREWKTQRIDAATADAVVAGFNRGAFAAAPVGCMVRWLVAPDQPPCPDADDNALAGAIERGTAFPTGHVHAPAHPGCRCQVVIAPR